MCQEKAVIYNILSANVPRTSPLQTLVQKYNFYLSVKICGCVSVKSESVEVSIYEPESNYSCYEMSHEKAVTYKTINCTAE